MDNTDKRYKQAYKQAMNMLKAEAREATYGKKALATALITLHDSNKKLVSLIDQLPDNLDPKTLDTKKASKIYLAIQNGYDEMNSALLKQSCDWIDHITLTEIEERYGFTEDTTGRQ